LSQFHNSEGFITAMNVLQPSNLCPDPLLANDSITFGLRYALALATEASLFKTTEAEAFYRAAYGVSLQLWPVQYESLNIPTQFGLTHVLACGPAGGEPVLLLPAMAFSATM
jgi:hypothetical protein